MKNTQSLFATLIFTFGVLFHIQAQDLFTNGLVAYYPFNGNANDLSGNNNNGSVFGAILVNNRFGITNSAYSFTGGGSTYISIPDSSTLDITNAITLTLWIKTQGGGYAQPRLLSKGPPAYELILSDTGSSPSISFNIQNLGSVSTFPISLGQNNWIFVTGTYDGQSMRIYTNGVVVGQTNILGNIAVNNEPLGIGENLDDYSDFVNGQIDDIRIYNRALSSNEVAQLYAIEFGPHVDLIKAVKPSFSGLSLGTNYQLQVSSDLNSWTNQGSAFSATNTSMIYPQYWDVDNWNKLFFRLQVAP